MKVNHRAISLLADLYGCSLNKRFNAFERIFAPALAIVFIRGASGNRKSFGESEC